MTKLGMKATTVRIDMDELMVDAFSSEYESATLAHSVLSSLGIVLPSQKTHVSFCLTEPPVQTWFSSIVHDGLHPSPLRVLLSSHSSDPVLRPSPQTVMHSSLVRLGSYPGSQVVHGLDGEMSP